MATPSVRQAVEAAIVAAAHVSAHQSVTQALASCQRLGSLSSGRWRAAARDLERIEGDLSAAFEQVEQDLARLADQVEVPEEALWAAGEAASLLETFREGADEWLDDSSDAARLLKGDLVYGVQVMDEAEAMDKGTTLLFTWADPLEPVVWPWEGTWIAGTDDSEELDLFTNGALGASEATLGAVAKLLSTQPEAAELALVELADALTRRALLGDPDEDDGAEEDEPGMLNGQA